MDRRVAGKRAELLGAVDRAFLIMAILLAGLWSLLLALRPLVVTSVPNQRKVPARMFDALASPWAVFGAVAIGLYVGAEVSIGSIMINFLNQRQILGLPLEVAGGYLANFYWGGALCGRLVGTLLLTRVRAARLLAACWHHRDPALRDRSDERRSGCRLCGTGNRIFQFDHVPDDLLDHARAIWSFAECHVRPALRRNLRRGTIADGSRSDCRSFRPQSVIHCAVIGLYLHSCIRSRCARPSPGRRGLESRCLTNRVIDTSQMIVAFLAPRCPVGLHREQFGLHRSGKTAGKCAHRVAR